MILVTGDLHAEYEHLNKLINKKKPKLVICCGDFGYWPKFKNINDLKNGDTKVLFCDGNHEDHWALRDRITDELAPNVFYMPRGSTYTLPDGRTILFMGGANSIDKHLRTIGKTWFPEETITQNDVLNVPLDLNVDIVISHTCPNELLYEMLPYNSTKDKDPSYKALSYILETYQPKLWYFGHWHIFKKGVIPKTNTKWTCLSAAGFGDQWWIKLQNEK